MKPITGQYECLHRSGVGLDYFTSRIDRLTLQGNGRFVLIVQDRSRIANAAQSIMSGQQANAAAPETRREGHYTCQDKTLTLFYDDGAQEQGQFSWNGDGVQIENLFFNKVSDSTLLPPTHRLKQNMDDIAKGMKIAGTIGGFAMKAAKTIHNTMQTTQESDGGQPANAPAQGQGQYPPPAQSQRQYPPPVQNQGQYSPSAQGQQPMPGQRPMAATPPPAAPVQHAQSNVPEADVETLYCDQCGARVRPGKRFCNNCGAQLP